jgi:hypothetical protein
VRLRAIQTKISRELRSQYKLPEELPHRMFTLLMLLDAEQNGHNAGRQGLTIAVVPGVPWRAPWQRSRLGPAPPADPKARCSGRFSAYLNLTTELSEWSHWGHSKVRKSWPSLWGSIRASIIVVVHLGHVGRRIASDEEIDEGE